MLKQLLYLLLLHCQFLQARPAFPKVFGAATGHVSFSSLALHEDSNLIICGGYLYDEFGFAGTYSAAVAYKGTDFPFLWAKVYNANHRIFELELSPDGNTLAIYVTTNVLADNFIQVVNPLTGVRSLSIKLLNIESDSMFTYHQMKMKVLSGTFPSPYTFVAVTNIGSYDYSAYLFKVSTSTFLSSPSWGKVSSVKSYYHTNEMSFGETESILYRFGQVSGYCIAQRLDASTGAPIKLYQYYGCTAAIGVSRFGTKYFPESQQHLSVGFYLSFSPMERKVWYILEDLANNSLLENKVYYDSTADFGTGPYISATHIVSKTEIISILFSGGYDDLKTYVTTINLQTLTVTTKLPKMNFGSQQQRYVQFRFRKDGSTFYYAASAYRYIYKSSLISFYMDNFAKGFLYSYNGLESCISTSPENEFSGTLTLQTSNLPTTTSSTDLSSASISFSQGSISGGTTILESALYSIDSQCSTPAELAKIYVLSEVSSVTSHTFFAAVATFTYSQVWFQVTQTQGTTAAVSISYSITMSDGITACPSWLTINAGTGLLTMTSSSTVGTYSILIKGTILSTQTITRALTIIAVVNNPPTLEASPPLNTDVMQYSSSTLPLSGTDAESDAVTLSVFEVGTAALPAFITYDGITKLLTIAPIGSTSAQEYHIRVTLTTSYHTTIVNFSITVLLNHPPSLIEIPPLVIDVSQASTNTVNLEGTDLENDAITLTIYEIGSSPLQLPSFMIYDAVLKELSISPTLFTTIQSYSIQVKLETLHHTTTQDFSVNVIAYNNPPTLVQALPSSLEVLRNIQYTINLAAVDLDSDPITTTVFEVGSSPQSLPNFMLFDPATSTLKLLPSETTPIQSYNIRVRLASLGNTVNLDFEVTVQGVINKQAAERGESLKNRAPPMFETELPTSINLIAGTQTVYSLPAIFDLDGDAYFLTASLGESAIFTTQSGSSFTFQPAKAHIKKEPYIIKLRLTDVNVAPKSLLQFLFITVESGAKQNQTQNATTNGTTSGNTTNSTGSGIEIGVPSRTIGEAQEQGATIFNSTAEMLVFKADRFGVIKVLFMGQFLISDLIDRLEESDFSARLVSQGNRAVPFSIASRNSRSGIIEIQLQFEDPTSISAGNDFDMVELSLNNELLITSGLRRRVLFGGGVQDVVKVLKIKRGLARVKAIPAQLSQGKQICHQKISIEEAELAEQIEDTAEFSSYFFVSSFLVFNIFMQIFMPQLNVGVS
ncbi:hypothetical protein FGO68_gene10293 [Halteria grandinella]|uniref:Cadherin domain-containing protein n=1 Tax=Halteria grandinella TaxID=5974 RepID=A0A8J8T990_HALGN|nr:hypothetical protein FGO68_gene10293 [Halteria grandinella]